MKIRNKLALQFTFIVAFILFLFSGMIYYTSSHQIREDFYETLRDRALTTAYIFLEEDAFSPELYETISQRYLRTLSEEDAQIFDHNNNPIFLEPSEIISYNDELINYIRQEEYYEFTNGKRQAVGIFYEDNEGDVVVILSAIDVLGTVRLNDLLNTLLIGFLISVFILFFTGRFFATQALKPIPKIVNQVKNISASNLSIRLEEAAEKDEIGELAVTFNNMLDRFQDTFSIQQRFVANASHELRTPLTSMIGEVEITLKKQRSPAEYEVVLKSIHQDALTLHELITGLLNLAEAESEKIHEAFNYVRVDEIAIEAGILMEKKYPNAKVQVNYTSDNTSGDQFIIPANRALLLNAFTNIIDNAIKFSPDKPVVKLKLEASETEIMFSVKDYGIGISKSELDHIYDPFYRSKDVVSYKGYGIGLSLVKRVLSIINGKVVIDSKPGHGTTVTVYFKK